MTSKLKVSEIFGPAGYWEYQKNNDPKFISRYGVTQGEGRFVGIRSVFLRMFGCNLRCPSFGLDHGVMTEEPFEIAKNIHLYKSIGELPAAQFGCDSYYSVYPEFKSLSPMFDLQTVADQLNMAAGGSFFPKDRMSVHLVITGGEPLLPGWQGAYGNLLNLIAKDRWLDVTFETNGTQELLSSFDPGEHRLVTFSISPKLYSSGHTHSEAIDVNNIAEYLRRFSGYLKFVVQQETDFDEIDEIVNSVQTLLGRAVRVFIMPEGGTVDEYKKHVTLDIVAAAVKRGYDITPRLQVMIGDNITGW